MRLGSSSHPTLVRGTDFVVQMRMGKGKGSFDHWATRMAVNQILFEIRGALHEQIARDAFRLAGQKLPGKSLVDFGENDSNSCLGQWEFVHKGEPPVVGITKLDGVTLEDLKRPRKPLEVKESLPGADAAPVESTPPPPAA